jgi:hypothetical protein
MTKDFGKSDWLYQSRIAPNLKEKIKCLEHVLLIDLMMESEIVYI